MKEFGKLTDAEIDLLGAHPLGELGLQVSGLVAALVALAVALRKNGALLPGQFQAEIRADLNRVRDPAAPDRADYKLLHTLANLIDEDEAARAKLRGT